MQTISKSLPNAIFPPAGGIDETVAWHYGDPFAEQRMLARGEGTIDLSHYSVLELTGKDRLEFLHALTTNHLTRLQPGESAFTLDLSNQGFVLNELHVIAQTDSAFVISAPESGAELLKYLLKMRFRMQVDVFDRTEDLAVLWEPIWQVHDEFPTWLAPAAWNFSAREILVPRDRALQILQAKPAGIWAREALRVAAKVARIGFETDHHTIPMEAGWLEGAIHMNKGCYRGQETISKVVRMGQPPRRLEMFLLSGDEELPKTGTEIQVDGKAIGFVGTAVQHYEFGPIALGLVKRSVPADAAFQIASQAASLWDES